HAAAADDHVEDQHDVHRGVGLEKEEQQMWGVEEAHRRIGEERVAAALIRVPQQPLAAVPRAVHGVQLVRQVVDVDVERCRLSGGVQLDQNEVRGRDDQQDEGGYVPQSGG